MTPPIGRRDLLKGAAAVGATIAAGPLASCAGAPEVTAPTTATTATAATGRLERLGSLIRGQVVMPSDSRYDAARLVWNARFDEIRPSAVVEVADAGDVATVVRFARDNGLRVRVRNGGHSFAGYSTAADVVVDVRRLTDVVVAGDQRTARLGSGLTALDAYTALWSTKKAIPAGLCPTVGISGLTTGGGLGVFGREYGLTSDSLVALEIVTADGQVVRADEQENADLLWATRGGGGGTFGILTSLAFDLVPADMPFTHATYVFPWSAATHLVEAWQAWLSVAPRQTWSVVEFLTQDPAKGTPTAVLEVVHAGSADGLRASVADLLAAVGTDPVESSSETTDFLSDESDFFCKGFKPDECRLADVTARGKIARPALYVSSNVAKSTWPTDGLEHIVEWIERRQRDPILTPQPFDPSRTVGKLIFEPADAAVRDVAPDATAFVHRDALFVMQYQARWLPSASADVARANIDWVKGMYDATASYRSGFAYQNYIDPLLDDWQRAYYGENLDRLRSIKTRVDPDNFFSFAQSIPPA